MWFFLQKTGLQIRFFCWFCNLCKYPISFSGEICLNGMFLGPNKMFPLCPLSLKKLCLIKHFNAFEELCRQQVDRNDRACGHWKSNIYHDFAVNELRNKKKQMSDHIVDFDNLKIFSIFDWKKVFTLHCFTTFLVDVNPHKFTKIQESS